ncbi:MAG: hypothetical protein JXA82_07150 [Sedimentisphaerales bacterium]|nr:hypothetical protein [Sedimentisphaerales bacterium]
MKILAFLSVLAAVGTAGWVATDLLGRNEDSPKVLSELGVLEQFIAGRPGTENTEEKESPLVTQARLFALGIDPPPPPKPVVKPPVETTRTIPVARQPEPEIKRPEPKGPFSTKFQLLATAWYPKYPSKSLALLDLGGTIGRKWHRPGEKVNHQTIQEIYEDHIVVLNDSGQPESVALQRKPEPKYKLMLKSEAEKLESAVPPIPTGGMSASAIPSLPSNASRATSPIRPPASTSRSSSVVRAPTRIGASSATSSGTEANSDQPDRTYRTPPTLPTPEERRKTVDNDINNIKRLMQESGKMAEMTEDEKAEELKAWNALLQILQAEKTRLNEVDQKSGEGTAKNGEDNTESKSY